MKLDPEIVLILVFFIVWAGFLYFHYRTKSGFQYLKSKFGENISGLYGYPTIKDLILDLSKDIKYWITEKDSFVIDIDGKKYPLIYGDVDFPSYHITVRSWAKAYYVITDEENQITVDKNPELFEFADTNGKYSLYWVKNLKDLVRLINSKNCP